MTINFGLLFILFMCLVLICDGNNLTIASKRNDLSNGCQDYNKGQIWEYGPGSYFIQVSECEWIQFVKNLFWAKFKFDEENAEKVLYLSRKNYELDIFENQFNFYELKSGQDRQLSATEKGKWINLTTPCQTYKSDQVFQLKNGDYFEQLPDCHWFQFDSQKQFVDYYDFVELKEDTVDRKILVLSNDLNYVEIHENTFYLAPINEKDNLKSQKGQWINRRKFYPESTTFAPFTINKVSETKIEIETITSAKPIKPIVKSICSKTPCLNGGTCVETAKSYTCQCPQDFTGKTCDTMLNPEQMPFIFTIQNDLPDELLLYINENGSLNFEALIDAGGDSNVNTFNKTKFKLLSEDKSYAVDFEIGNGLFKHVKTLTTASELNKIYGQPATKANYMDMCLSRPCLNEGVCIAMDNSYKCNCPAGFTEANCEKRVDFDEVNPKIIKKPYEFTIRNDLSYTLYLFTNENSNVQYESTIEPGKQMRIDSFHGRKYVLQNDDKTYRCEFQVGVNPFKKPKILVSASLIKKLYNVLSSTVENKQVPAMKQYAFSIRNDVENELYMYTNENNAFQFEAAIQTGDTFKMNSSHGRKYALMSDDKTYVAHFQVGYKAFKKADVSVLASVLEKIYSIRINNSISLPKTSKAYEVRILNDLGAALSLYSNDQDGLIYKALIERDKTHTISSYYGQKYLLINEEKPYRVEFQIGYKAFKKFDISVTATLLGKIYGVQAPAATANTLSQYEFTIKNDQREALYLYLNTNDDLQFVAKLEPDMSHKTVSAYGQVYKLINEDKSYDVELKIGVGLFRKPEIFVSTSLLKSIYSARSATTTSTCTNEFYRQIFDKNTSC